MSLITAIASKNGFVIMTGDRREVTVRRDGSYYVSSDNKRKVTRLTDFVLYGDVGRSDVSGEIEKRLRSIVTPDDDLGKCKTKLQQVIDAMKVDEEYGDLMSVIGSAGVLMTGFYKSGSIGMLSFKTGEGTEIDERSCDQHAYLAEMKLPSVDEAIDATFGICLFLDDEEEEKITEQDASIRLIALHKLISYLENRVSPHLDYYLLYREGDEIKFDQRYFDTLPLQKSLPSAEQVHLQLLLDIIEIQKEYREYGRLFADKAIEGNKSTFRFRNIR